MNYFKSKGIDVSYDDINSAWDMAVDSHDNDDVTSVEIDGEIISNKEDAYDWLKSKIGEYGNTYHFPKEDLFALNKLISVFGNTYFWR